MNNDKIFYPAKFEPSNCPVFVRNDIEINATPEKVWFWLTNATTWSEWYFNASKMQIVNQHNNHLLANTKFNWRTFGAKLESEVKEFVPFHRLAWEAKGTGISAYHAWLIVPTENGCKVITEETQHGWLCRLGKLLMPNRMCKFHQIWLDGLKTKSETIANPSD
jgi:uncharacterized protein YndB with AHSA1/START domain